MFQMWKYTMSHVNKIIIGVCMFLQSSFIFSLMKFVIWKYEPMNVLVQYNVSRLRLYLLIGFSHFLIKKKRNKKHSTEVLQCFIDPTYAEKEWFYFVSILKLFFKTHCCCLGNKRIEFTSVILSVRKTYI